MDISKDCKDVARHWGTRMPMMAMEECGELIQAICHVERAFDNRPDIHDMYAENMEKLVDEMGDVYIALEALKQYYRIPQAKIDMRMEKKLKKQYPAEAKRIFQGKEQL